MYLQIRQNRIEHGKSLGRNIVCSYHCGAKYGTYHARSNTYATCAWPRCHLKCIAQSQLGTNKKRKQELACKNNTHKNEKCIAHTYKSDDLVPVKTNKKQNMAKTRTKVCGPLRKLTIMETLILKKVSSAIQSISEIYIRMLPPMIFSHGGRCNKQCYCYG